MIFDLYTAHPAFDRSAGRVSLSANSGGRLQASVRVFECFDVTGAPPGAPADGTLEFHVDLHTQQSCGGSGCGVRFEATLALPGDSTRADANLQGPANIPRSAGRLRRLTHDPDRPRGLPAWRYDGMPELPAFRRHAQPNPLRTPSEKTWRPPGGTWNLESKR